MSRPLATFAAILAMLLASPDVSAQYPVAQSLALALHELSQSSPKVHRDPFPIQRVLLPSDKHVPAPAAQDPLRKMAREEFESRVRAANPASTASLVRSTYRARFQHQSLVGTGEWAISGFPKSSLPLDDLRISMRDLRWKDGEGLLYGTPRKLWVDRVGRHSLDFAWSARGIEEPGLVRFEIGIPASPLSQLTLDLPSDLVPVVKAEQHLVGPTAAEGGRNTWTLHLPGVNKIELSLRKPLTNPVATPIGTATRSTRIDLQPGLASSTMQYEFASMREPISTCQFEVSTGHTVTDVTSPGLESWQWLTAPEAGKPALILAKFREPTWSASVRVNTVAALPTRGEAWPLPTVTMPTHVLHEDTYEVRVPPDVRLESWSEGDYRLLRSNASAESSYTLVFTGSLPTEPRPARRPVSLRVSSIGPRFTSAENLEWRIDAQRSRITERFHLIVERGPLSRIVCTIPAGFTPISATSVPADPTAVWTTVPGGAWVFEPTTPIPSGESVDLRLELRGPPLKLGGPETRVETAIPRVTLIGSIPHEGKASITLAPPLSGWHAGGDPPNRPGTQFSIPLTSDTAAKLVVMQKPQRAAPPSDSPRNNQQPAEWKYRDVSATLTLDPHGQPHVEVAGRILSAGSPEWNFPLPDGSLLEYVSFDDKWTDVSPHADCVHLKLPSIDANGLPFQFRYALPNRVGLWGKVPYAWPQLPGRPIATRFWNVEPQYLTAPNLLAPLGVDPSTRTLISTTFLTVLSFSLAVLLLLGGLSSFLRRRLRRVYWWFCLVIVLLVAAAAVALPEAWLPFLVPLLLAAALSGILTTRTPTTAIRPGTLTLGLLGFLTATVAQAPEIPTVYLLAEDHNRPNELTAWVPQSLQRRLATLAASPLPAVVLTDAMYTGDDSTSAVTFDAVLRLQVTQTGTQTFTLPLVGLRLESLALDGKPTYPQVSADAYTIPISGLGSHKIDVRFTVPIAAMGNNREIRFGIPSHPSSRVKFSLIARGRFPTVLEHEGSQKLDVDTNSLEAELGAKKAVNIRWRVLDSNPRTNAESTASELMLWNLDESHAEAEYTCLHTIRKGVLTNLSYDVPSDLEPSIPNIRSLDPEMRGATIGLRSWTLSAPANGQRRLRLELQNPVVGEVCVQFRLALSVPYSARPLLGTPRTTTGEPQASYLGVRLNGVRSETWQLSQLAEVPADSVVRAFALVPEMVLEKATTRFLRKDGTAVATVRPQLRLPPPDSLASYELAWTLGHTATVRASAKLDSPTAVSAMELSLPAEIAVEDVSANELAGWSRVGNQLRVWFKNEVRSPVVQWKGKWTGYKPDGAEFSLPVVGLPPNAIVRIRTGDDVVLVERTPTGSTMLPAFHRDVRFSYQPAKPRAVYQVSLPETATLRKRVEVVADRTNPELRYRCELQLVRTQPQAVTLQLAPATTEAKLTWPKGTIVNELATGVGFKRYHALFPASAVPPEVQIVFPNTFREESALPLVEFVRGGVPIPESTFLKLPTGVQVEPPSAVRSDPSSGESQLIAEEPVRLISVATTNPPANEQLASPSPSHVLSPTSQMRLIVFGFAILALALLLARRRSDSRLGNSLRNQQLESHGGPRKKYGRSLPGSVESERQDTSRVHP